MSADAQKVEEIFTRALEFDEPELRHACVRDACGGEQELFDRVNRLLQRHEHAEGAFPTEPPASTAKGPISEGPGSMIGRYKLLQQLGEGGCGVVYMAEQEEPVRRRVAIKIIKLGMDTRQVVARFEAERQALAMMDHPNIAKVFDAGATGADAAQSQIANRKSQIPLGRPYFVMELVRGVRITEYCDQHQLSTEERLRLFMQVCQAVQHAHQKGIIHRDLKPSNILVTLHDGVPVPKVIDFGIAKATTNQRLTDKTLFTAFEQFMGTPAYMSPEQAEMSGLDVDTRSDIYSLGVLLYELLTGRTPFDARKLLEEGLEEMRLTIRDKEPARPSTRLKTLAVADLTTVAKQRQIEPPRLIHLLRGDLDWIVMKALEKDRTRRYETANGLALDLEHYLNDEPVLARPPSTMYRFKKFARRHRGPVAAAAGFVVLLTAATAVSSGLALWANQEKMRAGEAQQLAEAQTLRLKSAKVQSDRLREEIVEKLWHSYLTQARANRWSSRPGQRFDSLDALAKAAAIRPSMELRNEAIACMTLPDLRFGRRLNVSIFSGTIATDRAFERYARSEAQGDVAIRRIADDAELIRLPGAGTWAWNAEFSHDGRFLVCDYHPSGRDFPNSFRLWNLSTRQVLLTLTNTWGGDFFSPDNRHFVVHFLEQDSVLYDLATLRERQPIDLSGLEYPASSFSPDSRFLAVASLGDSVVRMVEIESGRLLRSFAHPGPVRSVDWHPRNNWLATACVNGNLYLWDTETGRQLVTFQNHQMEASKVLFNPRGDLLLSAAWDSTLRLWDVNHAAQLLVMSVQYPKLRFNPEETLVGMVGVDDQLTLLEANTAPECRSLRLMPGQDLRALTCGHISADGRLLAAGSADGVILWDLRLDRELAVLSTEPVQSLAFLPDQTGLVICGEAGLFLHPLERPDEETSGEDWRLGPPRRLIPGTQFRSLSLTADGRRLAVAQYSSPRDTYPLHNLVFDLGSTNPSTVIKGPRNQGAPALSPDGHWLVTGIWRGKEISVWDARTGEKVTDLSVTDAAYYPQFSPDGRWVVAGTDEDFHCWEVGAWRPAYRLEPDSSLTSQPSTATFSPDGRMIAVFHRYNRTHLVDAERGQMLATLDLDRHVPLCFSPDGATLVLATEGGQLKLLDLPTIRRQLGAMNLDWDMPPLVSAATNIE